MFLLSVRFEHNSLVSLKII